MATIQPDLATSSLHTEHFEHDEPHITIDKSALHTTDADQKMTTTSSPPNKKQKWTFFSRLSTLFKKKPKIVVSKADVVDSSGEKNKTQEATTGEEDKKL